MPKPFLQMHGFRGGKLKSLFFVFNILQMKKLRCSRGKEVVCLEPQTRQIMAELRPEPVPPDSQSQAFPYHGLPSGRQAEPGVWIQLGLNQ